MRKFYPVLIFFILFLSGCTNEQKFEPISYTLEFYSGDVNCPLPIVQNPGTPLKLPVIEKDQYFFYGWFLDEECKELFTSSLMPNKDTKLFAKWVEGNYEDFSFVFEDQSYKILEYKNNNEIVYIPMFYQDLPVTVIGEGAFFNNDILSTVYISSYVHTIETEAFFNNSSLIEVIFPKNSQLSIISERAFSQNQSLKAITLPKNLITINNEAFAYNSNLENVIFSEAGKLKTIDDYAFRDCNLHEIVFPNTLETIGLGSFYNSSKLKNIIIPSNVDTIGNYAFFNSGIEDISFSPKSSLRKIGNSAFELCVNLPNIVIPQSVTQVGSNAFNGCVSLINVVFEEEINLKILSSGLFENCSNLSNLSIPKSVTTLNSRLFSFTKIEEITLSENITRIDPFALDDSLVNKINIHEENLIYSSIDDVIYKMDTIVRYPVNKPGDSYTVIEGIIKIGVNAFANTKLKNINLPSTLQVVDEKAFYKSEIETINFPFGLNKICSYAFYQTENLSEIIFPDSLVSIGSYAFNGSNLKSVHIPKSVDDIDIYAFANNVYLNNVTFDHNTNIKTLNSGIFCMTQITDFYVPESIQDFYMNSVVGINPYNLYFTSLNPPEIHNLSSYSGDFKIFVPIDLLETYQNSSTWLDIKDYLFPIQN